MFLDKFILWDIDELHIEINFNRGYVIGV